MKKLCPLFISALMLAFVIFAAPAEAAWFQKPSAWQDDSLARLDRNIVMRIFIDVVNDGKSDPGNLRLTCKDWKAIIDMDLNKDSYGRVNRVWQRIIQTAYGGRYHMEIYDQFAQAEMLYTPESQEKPVVTLRFMDLKNPFDGVFDLSRCDDNAKHYRIVTSVKEFYKRGTMYRYELIGDPENLNRFVVLISPLALLHHFHFKKFEKFLVTAEEKKEAFDLIKFIKSAFDKKPEVKCFDPPFGVLMRYGNERQQDKFEYTTLSAEGLNTLNIAEIYEQSKIYEGSIILYDRTYPREMTGFCFKFKLRSLMNMKVNND